MPIFIFNTVVSWFLRNNAFILKHIMHFLMQFQTMREILDMCKRIKILQWFIPFLREVYQLPYIDSYTPVVALGKDSIKFLDDFLAHLRVNSDIPRALVSTNDDNIQFLDQIFKGNKFEYTVSKEYQEKTTWHLINRIEIEYFVINANMVITIGDRQTHDIGKALRSQIGTNKPLLTFEIWNHINCPLPIQVAIPTSLTDGNEFSRSATVYIKKRQATLLDKNLQVNYIIKDSNFVEKQDKKWLVSDIIFIINNSIEAFLSQTDDLITQAFALDSITIALNNLNTWIDMNKFNYEDLVQASAMSGMAINHTQYGIINSICVAIRKVYDFKIQDIKPIVLMALLHYQSKNRTIFKTLVKCAKGIGYNLESDEDSVKQFMNDIVGFYKKLEIPSKIELPNGQKINKKIINKILYYTLIDYPTMFAPIQIEKKDIKKIIISIFTNDNLKEME